MKKMIFVISMLLIVFLVSCNPGFIYDSLDSDTPYLVFCTENFISKCDTACFAMTLRISISVESDDSQVVEINHRCKKKISIHYNNNVYEADVFDPGGDKTTYLAEFDFGNGIKFDPVDDSPTLELCFMENDSIINKYRYEHD